MSVWAFLDYVSERGVNEIHAWLNSPVVTKLAKSKINGRIAALQGFPLAPEGWISAYTGYLGLYELRVAASGVQYRPLGFYGPGPERRQFSLLIGATERDDKIPRPVLESANERKDTVIRNPARVVPHDFS
jgi:hypothetical protein